MRRNGAFDPPRWLLACTGALLLWIYGFGLADNPLKWEEQRRCLVAMEMIHSGDYVVPRVFGEPYFNKPPLFNWLLALFSGYDFGNVGPLSVRAVSLFGLLGTCLVLWRLGLDGRRDEPHLLPPLIFLTCGIVCQFGRAGEIDMLFTFLVTAALACFELGRRRSRAWLQWVAPQLLIGVGVLAKVVAPIYVYPPLLFCAWRYGPGGRHARPAFGLGLLACVAVVAAWLVPYSLMSPLAPLISRWSEEVTHVATGQGSAGLGLHLLRYPLTLLVMALPWSACLILVRRTSRRAALARIARDPFHGLAAAVLAWGALLLLCIPGLKERYGLPFLPWLAVLVSWMLLGRPLEDDERDRVDAGRARVGLARLVRHPVAWSLLTVALLFACFRGSTGVDGVRTWLAPLTFGIGLLAIGAYAAAVHQRPASAPILVLLLTGLIYGVVVAGVWEERNAARGRAIEAVALQLSEPLDPAEEIVCECEAGDGQRLGYLVSQRVGRPLRSRPSGAGEYFLIAPQDGPVWPGAERLAEAGRYAAWRMHSGQATARAVNGMGAPAGAAAPASIARAE